jgi:hypothetical protein
MNWDEEYHRLFQEFRALESKLSSCVAINAELVVALIQITAVSEDNPNMTTNFIHEIASAARAKAKALQVGPDLAIGR